MLRLKLKSGLGFTLGILNFFALLSRMACKARSYRRVDPQGSAQGCRDLGPSWLGVDELKYLPSLVLHPYVSDHTYLAGP